ncbi:hypothetical protein WCU98_24620, partial [Pectobacterium parmentieri]|uniref:hypothetical protein n=1 Tax=Pectobacterium parmentieri TaxID=1905730 RepID=UPI003015F4D1
VDTDLSESLVFKKQIYSLETSSRSSDEILFETKDLGYKYGQYRAIFEVLLDTNEINDGDLDFYVHVGQYSIK